MGIKYALFISVKRKYRPVLSNKTKLEIVQSKNNIKNKDITIIPPF
jgi:hypothetical protein